MITIRNDKFVWLPEVKETVIIKKRYLPKNLTECDTPIHGKIKSINGNYIVVKYKNCDVGDVEHYRNELKPYGSFKQKKSKKQK
jgi:hypothetical protein